MPRKGLPAERERFLVPVLRPAMLRELATGWRNPPPPRAVPHQLEGSLRKSPEPPPTERSKRETLQTALRNLPFNQSALLQHCRDSREIRSAAFFGSILREDFLDTSDVDILLDCERLVPLHQHREAFEQIFGRRVDVRSVHWLQRHYNPLGRAMIWNTKQVFYERDGGNARS